MKIGYTSVFDWLLAQNKRYILLKGGAGSSKSYSIAQYLILNKALQEQGKRILIFRKTFPSLRTSCIPLILELLNQYNIPYDYNKTEHIIYLPTGSTITFSSLDDPMKLKSWHEPNYIWIEEATELNFTSFLQLDLRLRGQNELPNQMWMTFNPIDINNWIYQNFVQENEYDIALHHSTYHDNPFLPEDTVKQIQRLETIDQNYYRVYALGEWGVLENLIYNNYETVEELPESVDEIFYGVDFGFNNPSAVVKISVKDERYFLEEKLYEEKLTNQDLIQRMESIGIRKETHVPIYADCAEPARIEEIYKAGFNIIPSVKDKNSVKDGIDFCKRHRLFVHKDSVNLLKELNGYKWKEDKDGFILDEPVKFKDHLCDAFRYALYTHEIQRGGTTKFIIG